MKSDVDCLATRTALISNQHITNESVINHQLVKVHRSQSCALQDNAIYSYPDSALHHPRFALQTYTKSNAASTSSQAPLRGASSRNSLTDISEHFDQMELVADPDYYHTVHGGHINHITASRSTEPFAPITRVHIGNHNIGQVDQPKVETAYVAGRSTTNLFNLQTTKRIKSSVVRPLLSDYLLFSC